MGGSDLQFCLRWNNFGSTMTSALHSLHQGGDFVDVTLAVEGIQMQAHKLVLSACSPYFRDILKNNPCQHPVIILREVSMEDLKAVLTFMYEGQVNISQQHLHTFMRLAESLQIRGLTDTQNERARLEKEMFQNLIPGALELTANVGATSSSACIASSTPPVFTKTITPQPKDVPALVRTRSCESPVPGPKRRKSSPSRRKTSPSAPVTPSATKDDGEADNSDDAEDSKRDIRNMLEVKLEPVDYASGDESEVDEARRTAEEEQARSIKALERAVAASGGTGGGGGGGGGGMASAIAVTSTHPVFVLQRRNSQEKATPAANLHPEFPQDSTWRTPPKNTAESKSQSLPYPCPFCEKAYTSWGFRRRHIKGYHTSSPELPCKWCYSVLPSHQDWEEHVTRTHNLSMGDARNGLLILEEAHMVLQIAQPTRIDSLMELIKNKKDKDKDEENKDGDHKDGEKQKVGDSARAEGSK